MLRVDEVYIYNKHYHDIHLNAYLVLGASWSSGAYTFWWSWTYGTRLRPNNKDPL